MPCLFSPTKKLWKSVACAVANYRYYGVADDHAWYLDSPSDPTGMRWYVPNLFQKSDLVWCEGPRGGIRFIHQNWNVMTTGWEFRKVGYITNNTKAMQEFMWVKLKAQNISVK